MFIFFFCYSLSAQHYKFINYSIEQGLAQSQINAICQDGKGYLWIGTNGGLSRFDGKKFTNYFKDDGLLDNQVNSIIKDSKGTMWIGTLGGINKFDGIHFSSYKLKSAMNSFVVKTLCEDREGNLWLGTDGMGVARFNGKQFEYFDTSDSLAGNLVRSIFCDNEGTLWFATKNGISLFKNNQFSSFLIDGEKRNASSVSQDENGKYWFSTYGDGVYSYYKNRFLKIDQKNGLVSNQIRSVVVDKQNNVWLSSIEGVSKISATGIIENFQTKNGLTTENIYAIYHDNHNNIWLGSGENGLFKFPKYKFNIYNTDDGLSSNIIMTINQKEDGALYFGNYGWGIDLMREKKVIEYTTANGICDNTIITSYLDKKGTLWFGTNNGVVKHLFGKSFQCLKESDGLVSQAIYSVFQDNNNRYWLGGENGVSLLDEKEKIIKNFNSENGFDGGIVYSILQDKKNNLWFATSTGLIGYDQKKFTNYSSLDTSTVNYLMTMVKDQYDHLWLGTDNGIVFFDKKEQKVLKLGENNRSNTINSLVVDNFNHLWAGTNDGIYSIDLSSFYEKQQWRYTKYGTQEGLPTLECNQNAAFKDLLGNLWFGTVSGAVQFMPIQKTNVDANLQNQLHITNVRLFLENVDWSKYNTSLNDKTSLPINLKINYKQNHLTFDYIGLYLSNPDNVRYQFILEGFDESWSPITKETYATYSNLAPGEYLFKVIASVDGYSWSNPVLFSFTITPPYWKTKWFIAVSTFLFLGFLFILYRWRMLVLKRKREAEQLMYKSKLLGLEQQTLNASMNRHFIFNALNSIQYYINKQDKLSANKYLTSFAKLIRKNLDSSVNNMVSLTEELERLKLYLSLEHMRFENKFTYDIVVDSHLNTDLIEIPPMLLQPYVENSIWHGILPLQDKSGKILIEVKQNKDSIVFTIMDNGVGIETSTKNKEFFPTEHDSKGVKITESRINILKKLTSSYINIVGPIDVFDKTGQLLGAKVEITLPLKING